MGKKVKRDGEWKVARLTKFLTGGRAKLGNTKLRKEEVREREREVHALASAVIEEYLEREEKRKRTKQRNLKIKYFKKK